ncbi:uncharacterized protein PHA67_003223 isoform 1-T1 [Liasis olivaceus]
MKPTRTEPCAPLNGRVKDTGGKEVCRHQQQQQQQTTQGALMVPSYLAVVSPRGSESCCPHVPQEPPKQRLEKLGGKRDYWRDPARWADHPISAGETETQHLGQEPGGGGRLHVRKISSSSSEGEQAGHAAQDHAGQAKGPCA